MAGDVCVAAFDRPVFDVSDFFGRSGWIAGNVETLFVPRVIACGAANARGSDMPASDGSAVSGSKKSDGGKLRAASIGGDAL